MEPRKGKVDCGFDGDLLPYARETSCPAQVLPSFPPPTLPNYNYIAMELPHATAPNPAPQIRSELRRDVCVDTDMAKEGHIFTGAKKRIEDRHLHPKSHRHETVAIAFPRLTIRYHLEGSPWVPRVLYSCVEITPVS